MTENVVVRCGEGEGEDRGRARGECIPGGRDETLCVSARASVFES
jgi:hypothetical protein